MAEKNAERSARTREALLAAARAVFAARGYGGAATPDIAAAAGVTRGALYHHFADKAEIFAAVVEAEQAAVAAAIAAATVGVGDPRAALLAGADGYFAVMADAGRRRILLLDGPAVLGVEAMARLDAAHGGGLLADGLTAAMRAGAIAPGPAAPLADLLSAAFDRAALAGPRATEHRHALTLLIDALFAAQPPGAPPDTDD